MSQEQSEPIEADLSNEKETSVCLPGNVFHETTLEKSKSQTIDKSLFPQ